MQTVIPSDTLSRRRRLRSLFSRRKRTVTAGSSHEKETLAQWVPQKSTMAEKSYQQPSST
jgi:hypothetical protein